MERAFELAPSNEDVSNALKRLYQKRDGSKPDRIRHNKVALARLYCKGGQYQQAIQELHEVLESEPAPGRLDLRLSLAEVLWRDGRREQAADAARSILQTAPDCLKAILILGKILIEKGRRDEGVAVLVRSRALDPENLVAQALFGADSPLPPEVVLLPRMRAEATAEIVAAPDEAESVTAAAAPEAAEVVEPAGQESQPAETTEPVEESALAAAREEVGPETPTPELPAGAVLSTTPPADQPAEEIEAAAVAPALEPVEPVGVTPPEAAQQETETVEATPSEPAPPAPEAAVTEPPVFQEPGQEWDQPRPVAEVMVPAAETDGLLLAPPPVELLAAPAEPTAELGEPVAEQAVEAQAVGPEPAALEAVATVEAETQSVPTEPVAAQPLGTEVPPPTALAVTELAGPAPTKSTTARRRRKKAAEAPPPLEAMAGVSAGLLSEIERCRQQLEVKPKDDDARLALARAYRDAAQIKLALQEYDILAHSKTKRTAEIVADMEGLVASRPDNLEAHELLADVYAKNGQLQLALQRYRWVLERMRQQS